MKLLHVIPYFGPQFGGPPANVANLAAHMKLRGIETAIITAHASIPIPLEKETVKLKVDGRIAQVDVTYCRAASIKFLSFSPSFSRCFQEIVGNYDGVLIHGLWQYPCSYAAAACYRSQIPHFVLTHAMLSQYSFSQKYLRKKFYFRVVEKRNLERANAVILMDEAEREFAKDLGIRNRTYLLFNALNQEDLIPSEINRKENSFKILFLGRIHPKKGLEYLVDAFLEIAGEFPEIRLSIAGPVEDKEYFDRLKKRINTSRHMSQVDWTGLVTGEEKRRFFSSGALFVLPSYDDSRPLSLLEAMGAGLPVITTLGCKMPEIDQRMGYVTSHSSSEIAAAIRRIYQNKDKAREMGEAGREYIRENFMWEKRIQELLGYIEEVLVWKK